MNPKTVILSLFVLGAAFSQPAPAVVNELFLERALTPSTLIPSAPLTIPPRLQQGLADGSMELRQRIIYDPTGNNLQALFFVVQSGEPMPAPINAFLADSVVGRYTMSIEKLTGTKVPQKTLAFTGAITSGQSNQALGDVTGAPYFLSMSYTGDTDAKPADIVHVVAGRVVVYSKTAAGKLAVPKEPTPPNPNAGPQIVVVAPANTVAREIQLDASGTTDSSGTPLRFNWRATNKTAVVLNPATAVATVQFSEGPGEYTFELIVTNGNNVSATKFVSVYYFGR